MEGFLYRAYDRAGILLYVGTTLSVSSRMAIHRTQSEWFQNLHEFKVRRYASIERARRVELRAISMLGPLYNKFGNRIVGQAEKLAARVGDEMIRNRDREREIAVRMRQLQIEFKET